MTKPDILTIGIPTYNRKEAILSCLDHLYEKKIHLKARILVIDNASEDQSYQIIHKKYSHVFDIYKNKYNIGFAGNTIELFKNCSTEYLLWLSDEDIIIESNIEKLITILSNNSYFFLCPQYYVNNNKSKLYRGNKKMKNVTCNLRENASHLPGLIFNVLKAKKIVNDFDTLKIKYPWATNRTPQLFIFADLLIQDYKKCMYLDFPICSQKLFFENSHDKVFIGTPSRGLVTSKNFPGNGGIIIKWAIHLDLVDYLNDLKKSNSNNITINKLLSYQKKRVYDEIIDGIDFERPDIMMDYNKAIYKNIILLPLKIIFYFLTKPATFLKKIYKYF